MTAVVVKSKTGFFKEKMSRRQAAVSVTEGCVACNLPTHHLTYICPAPVLCSQVNVFTVSV